MTAAAGLLSQIGVVWDFQREPDHAPVWFDLGRAYLAGGQLEQAREMFTRVVERRLEHIYFPVQFVRSHHFLAQIAKQAGDDAGARRFQSDYTGFWPDSNAAR
jgi:Tfp pilus assembly protein PilF